jgi:hypothetical protein
MATGMSVLLVCFITPTETKALSPSNRGVRTKSNWTDASIWQLDGEPLHRTMSDSNAIFAAAACASPLMTSGAHRCADGSRCFAISRVCAASKRSRAPIVTAANSTACESAAAGTWAPSLTPLDRRMPRLNNNGRCMFVLSASQESYREHTAAVSSTAGVARTSSDANASRRGRSGSGVCHPERSEGSAVDPLRIPRCARNDMMRVYL